MQEDKNVSFRITMSYFQIYNEQIRDLLINDTMCLEIQEDPLIGTIITNLAQVEINEFAEVMELISLGSSN